MEKYKLILNDTINVSGVTLFRIKALKSFGEVKKGDLGGYIENEDNLSRLSNAWVSGNAWVYGNAYVSDDACVSGNAHVYGDVWISSNACVSGNAHISGNVHICDNAHVSGNAHISGNVRIYDNAHVSDNARVADDVRIYDNACISGKTIVFGNACVSGNAHVSGETKVYGNAHILGDVYISDDIHITDIIMTDQLKNDYLDQAFESGLKKGTITEQATTVFKKLVREALASNQDIQIPLATLVSSLHPDTSHSETDMDLRELIQPEIEALLQTKVHVETADGGMVLTQIFSSLEVKTGIFRARLTPYYRDLVQTNA